MRIFLEDEGAVHRLVASQYKIAPDKLMRTQPFHNPLGGWLGLMDGWIDEWMDGWMDGWMDRYR